jgi:mannose-6-phosphate isomerase-like protein (cupin superfamily)/ketosteroid isomerase-like protein
VRIEKLERVEAFTTKDGSEIRELAGIPTGNAENQSLAEATVPPGGETEEHYHRASEEIYLFTAGQGRLRLGDDESEVAAGDTVVIPPGTRHKLWNTGTEPLKLLCCCAPPYSHEDTVLASQENVEVVRRGWDAWIGGDLDAVFEVFDPAVEWDTTRLEGWPEDEVYYGHEGIRQFFDGWLASWERYESGVEEYLDAGDDRGRDLLEAWLRTGQSRPGSDGFCAGLHPEGRPGLPPGGLFRSGRGTQSRWAAALVGDSAGYYTF